MNRHQTVFENNRRPVEGQRRDQEDFFEHLAAGQNADFLTGVRKIYGLDIDAS